SEPEVKQEQNEQVTEDCEAIRSELEVVQAKYGALQSENSELNATFNVLTADYDELTAKYNDLLVGTVKTTESDVEQAIFQVINQDRQNNGLNELEWTDSFYQWAKVHSDYMATTKRYQLSDQSYSQEIFRAVGYSTLDRITNAALLVWKESPTYTTIFLGQQSKYGTVAVSKSGDIFYITYFAHTQK
ncbi:CAP domain-containing protein, partial [Chloroflexota bacterium]